MQQVHGVGRPISGSRILVLKKDRPYEDKVCDKSTEWTDPTGVKYVTSSQIGRIPLEGQES